MGKKDGKGRVRAYSYFHSFTSDKFHAAHHVLLHLDELRELFREVRPEGTSGLSAENMACFRRDMSA